MCWLFLLTASPSSLSNDVSVRRARGVLSKKKVVNLSRLGENSRFRKVEFGVPGQAVRLMPIPGSLLVPEGAGRSSALPSFAPLIVPSALSPAPSKSFLALGDDNTAIPPDTYGSVGPDHLVVTLNTQVRVQDRNGNPMVTLSLRDFWIGMFTSMVFDPRVLYEPYGGRWVFVAVADASSADSSLLFAVSSTNDPTGNWTQYQLYADPNDQFWFDYPSLGFNKKWIAVQVNVYTMGGAFDHSRIYIFDKARLYSGEGAYTVFTLNALGGTQVPALTYDSTLDPLYLVSNWNGNSSGKGYLRLFSITGAVGSESFTDGPFVESLEPWDFQAPGRVDFAPQQGSAEKIQTNDARIQSVVYRNGSVWCCQTIFLPAGGSPTRCSVQWWQIDTSGNVLQRGRIDDPSGEVFYAFPSLAVNKNSDMLVGYSSFSADRYASASYSLRVSTDPPNTTQSEYIFKAGEASYYKTLGGTRNRWGDYSNTVVDPANDTDFWTIQEYASTPVAGSDRWGTWWAKLSPGSTQPQVTVSLQLNNANPQGANVVLKLDDKSKEKGQLNSAGQVSLSYPAGRTVSRVVIKKSFTSAEGIQIKTGGLSGTAQYDGSALANASVKLKGKSWKKKTTTNSLGQFSFSAPGKTPKKLIIKKKNP